MWSPAFRVHGAIVLMVACSGRPSDTTWVEPSTGMEFVLIEGGEFQMGLRASEPSDVRLAPLHSVELSEPFYLGRFEVTQQQWRQVMGVNPSHFGDCGGSCPVENVTWHDVQIFLRRLGVGTPGWTFRLPTEAEWEYACRAGTGWRYGITDTLDSSLANYDTRIPFDGIQGETFLGTPTPVGSFQANPMGLYDLSGNVWEWVQDEYCPYPPGPVTAPFGTCGTDTIPIRGGSWHFSANAARCGRRFTHHRNDHGFSIGFRVVAQMIEG